MGRTDWITKLAVSRFFLFGFENYSIGPTAWHYMKSFDQTPFFLSLVLCVYNVGALIAAPLFGLITDRVGNPRLIYLFSCLLKVIANVMYSVNINEYFPLFGRLVSGLADIGLAVLIGQIALQPETTTRTGNFVLLEGSFCLDSIFGPGIGGLMVFHANILGLEINENNSPGIILVVIWLMFLVFSLLLPLEIWKETGEKNRVCISYSDDEETSKALSKRDEPLSRAKLKAIFFDVRISCVFFLTFTSEVFSGTATFFTPLLALDHFHLHLIHTKLLFLNCTLFTTTFFLFIYLASEYIEERKLMSIALLLQIIAIAFLALLAIFWHNLSSLQYYILLFYVCFGMPYFMYPLGNSLLSKFADPQYATFVQGVSLGSLNFGIVISRVILSFVFTKTSLLYYCFGMALIWLIGALWFAVKYKNMAPNVLVNTNSEQ